MTRNASPAAAPAWIGIEAAAYHFPGELQDIEACAAQHNWPDARVQAILRSGCRHFHAAPDIGETELAERALARLFDETGLRPDEVGALIHVHTQLFSVPAAPRSLPLELVSRFGLRPVWAGSINQLNCSSNAAAIQLVQALMASHPQLRRAVIVSVDRVYGERFRLRQMSGVQSDGAACLLVARESRRNRIGALALRNYGKWHQGSDTNAAVEREMINLEWHYTRKVMQQAVADSGVALADYGCVLPHNSDHKGWISICKAMGIPLDILRADNILQKGHACCSDLAVNLADIGLAQVDAGRHLISVTQSNSGAFSALTLHPVARHDAN
ncbi:3-oxoacyl-ACP synthase [Chromobacterium alticapitis]|uniref:3-oxoacyl-ACP synthase n=1 Tax=Chromobacterium alticapitis TaxID=2073169 RepID=A0A2S5DI95_9NEIS|nr:3-oxoacyl-ACP synthase [Chromobacterium alticapitis]POZ62803.1 3-oxoacyl-ACP synthase [Chromobacterium alticapitis]